MKIFGFSTSVIIGVICAWLISEISFNNFFINLIIPLLLSSFVASFLISKDAFPPNFLLKFSVIKKWNFDSASERRGASGILSSGIFIILKTTFTFLTNPSAFGNNFIYITGFYIFSVLVFFFLGIMFGVVGGKAGVFVRDVFEKRLINKCKTSP